MRDKHSLTFCKIIYVYKNRCLPASHSFAVMDAESDSENIAVRFSRSPKHQSKEDFDGLTGDVLMPLVAGDEFEEEEGKL